MTYTLDKLGQALADYAALFLEHQELLKRCEALRGPFACTAKNVMHFALRCDASREQQTSLQKAIRDGLEQCHDEVRLGLLDGDELVRAVQPLMDEVLATKAACLEVVAEIQRARKDAIE